MEYRSLGRSGLKVSALCMGTMQFGWTADAGAAFEILSAAFEAGLNFLDTADVYSRWVEGNAGGEAETIIGNWMSERGIPRQELVIATKVRAAMGDGPNDQGLSRKHIMAAVDASLRRLQTDYIDLYQAHAYDDATPIDETLRAFDDLVQQGKVRYVGCSNYPAWRLMRALWTSDRLHLARYDSIQPHYSLAHRAEFERELADVCREYGLGVIPYSPLAAGFLSGKYNRGGEHIGTDRVRSAQRFMTDQNWDMLGVVREVAARLEKSPAQVALAWLLQRPGVSAPIIGPRTMAQWEDNLGALDTTLSAEDVQSLDQVSAWQ